MDVLSVYIRPDEKIFFKLTKFANNMKVGDTNSYVHTLLFRCMFLNGFLYDKDRYSDDYKRIK